MARAQMCWHLFTWGPAVEVIEPRELRDRLRQLLDDALGHHDAGSS